MRITSTHLIAADRFLDRSGLSFINNIVNCFLKIFRYCQAKKSGPSSFKNYWTYIDQKDKATCALGLIPVLGSIAIVAKERFEEWRVETAVKRVIKEVLDGESFEQVLGPLTLSQLDNLYRSPLFTDFLLSRGDSAAYHDMMRVDQIYQVNALDWIETSTYEEIS